MGARYRPWSMVEDKFIQDHCLDMSDEEIAAELGRSEKTVRGRRRKLRLQHNPRWSDQEVELLLQHFRRVPVSELAIVLKRSEDATRQKLRHLGFELQALERNQKAWSRSEIAIIEEHIDEPIPEIKRRLPSNRPFEAIHRKALELGRCNVHKGYRINNGYVDLYLGNGKYQSQHRRVMEETLNRPLNSEERVHHINGDHYDNRVSNLHLFKDQNSHGRCHWSLLQIVGELLEDGIIVFDGNHDLYRINRQGRSW